MILDEVCNESVYTTNPFHVLGLTVDVAGRSIRRRQEDVVEGLASMGDKTWRCAFEKYLLGNIDIPCVELAKTLFERLKDPEYFATEMFFWFWPQDGQSDSAVEAITSGERDKAVRIWQSDMTKPGKRGIVARHNLAVALHFYAVDGENYIRSFTGDLSDGYFKSVDRFWKASFELWEGLSDNDLFWDVFSERVEKLNDPRLDDEFINKFRERFPICFDNINADFLIAYARAGKMSEAKRHFDYMVSTMNATDDVEETLSRTFKPMVDRVRTLIKQCINVKEPKNILGACRELLNGSKNLIAIFKLLLPDGNAYTKGIVNEIVLTIDKRLRTYSKGTGDHKPCLEISRELLQAAATPLVKEKMQRAEEMWEGLVSGRLAW